MKSAIVLCAFVAAIVAQSDISSLPPCGQLCMNNMIALAPSLGCADTDTACLCKNVNFQYGIRDCSNAVCGEAVASTVISFGSGYCHDATAGTTGGSTTGATETGASTTGTGAAGTATTTAPAGTETGSGTSTETGTGVGGGTGSSSAITTEPIVSTETHGSDTITTTIGSTTIYGPGGVGGSSGTATGTGASATGTSASGSGASTHTGTGAPSSTITESSGASSTGSGASSTGSEASSSGTGAGGASSSSSTGAGAIQTVLPGFVAAAGLAALLL
ncbi:hypothetical protein OIDMADRAFT_148902 [Oidiodendron maius Zn]|uniref:CFEM domain-containing protein n=1 Tax=Oidiodendron maius (strain Zn) TaxID=913774 RepID=A0A0C3GGH8_OIDMZ|nr:hypothetical protein OIDMADRAFT_148902 [Oidiodendron maius Zn]